MNSSFAFEDEIDLSRFNTLYRTESPTDAAPISNSIPDGRYEVVVAEASLTTSQTSGNPMVRWVLRITGDTFRDRLLKKYSVFTENSIRFVRKELEMCGLHLDNLEDLKSRVQELEGIELEVQQVTKGDYTSIYFNRAIASRSETDALVADDDVPF